MQKNKKILNIFHFFMYKCIKYMYIPHILYIFFFAFRKGVGF